VYAINHEAFSLLDRLAMNRQKGELLSDDIVSPFAQASLRICRCHRRGGRVHGCEYEEELLRHPRPCGRVCPELYLQGSEPPDPSSVFIHPHASIGRDTTIYPNVFIEVGTKIGSNVTIYPHVRILRSIIDNHAVIMDST